MDLRFLIEISLCHFPYRKVNKNHFRFPKKSRWYFSPCIQHIIYSENRSKVLTFDIHLINSTISNKFTLISLFSFESDKYHSHIEYRVSCTCVSSSSSVLQWSVCVSECNISSYLPSCQSLHFRIVLYVHAMQFIYYGFDLHRFTFNRFNSIPILYAGNVNLM